MADNRCLDRVAIVLPSLDPDAKFGKVVKELVHAGFENIVIVDDGSDADHQKWFEEADRFSQCTVLHHDVNKGKGRALKTAFTYITSDPSLIVRLKHFADKNLIQIVHLEDVESQVLRLNPSED